MMYKRILSSIIYYVIGITLAFASIVPFLWMISTSLKSGGALLALPIQWIPENPTFDSYIKLFKLSGMIRSIFNSVILTSLAVIVALTSSSLAAFAFSKIKFKGSGMLFMFYLASMMLPSQVLFIPLYLIMNELNLVDSIFALVLPYLFQAFAVFMLRQQMMNIPDDYLDAAAIDGASLFKSFMIVFLPLCKTALATLAIIICMNAWNDYLLPLVLLTSNRNFTLPIILNSLSGQFQTEFNLLMAGSLVSVLPLLIIYIFMHRYFASGMQVGGIKG